MVPDVDGPSEHASEKARLARALAQLDTLVNWERRDRDAWMRRSLEPIEDLCRRLQHPERRFRCVHVAGTKGKGTTSALVAAGLRRAGLATGLYTSPHVIRIQERIQIDGRFVADGELAKALEEALAARESAVSEGSGGKDATWFDTLTAAGFLCFARAGVEWAVVECGLGGRLDSTNVVHGEVAVVTNIDLEHTQVLGNTRAAIAREKGGIVKPGSTLVTGVAPIPGAKAEDDAYGELRTIAHRAGVSIVRPATYAEPACPELYPPGSPLPETAPKPGVGCAPHDARTPTMLARNATLARLVLGELGRRGVLDREGRPLTERMLTDELVRSSALPGRLERFRVGATLVVIDAAHVPSSVRQVLHELANDPELPGKPFCILALGRDKDVHGILKALGPAVDRVFCTATATGPLVDAETLVREAAHLGIAAEKADDPAQALARALRYAGSERWVLVIGSFYLAGAIRAQLESEATP